jgi:hypothetical protein
MGEGRAGCGSAVVKVDRRDTYFRGVGTSYGFSLIPATCHRV